MRIAASTLKALLESNVLEIKFTRRVKKPGAPPTRRMLCTNSAVILKSNAGKRSLNYKPPSGPPKFNSTSKNIVIAWDIFKQEYRSISADNCVLISQMPVSGDGRDFWEYFNNSIHPMTVQEKTSFFNV